MAEQLCRVCAETKPASEYSRAGLADRRCRKCHAAYSHARYLRMKDYFKEKALAWRARTVDQRHLYDIRRKFGVDAETYRAMHAAQDGKCAICGNPPQSRRLGLDHDHATGAVRDLLCSRCNTVLGYVNDDPALLRALIAYLGKHSRIARIA